LKEREELVKIVVSHHPNAFKDRSLDDSVELFPTYSGPRVRSRIQFLFRCRREASHNSTLVFPKSKQADTLRGRYYWCWNN
jgi:hypothetical protein